MADDEIVSFLNSMSESDGSSGDEGGWITTRKPSLRVAPPPMYTNLEKGKEGEKKVTLNKKREVSEIALVDFNATVRGFANADAIELAKTTICIMAFYGFLEYEKHLSSESLERKCLNLRLWRTQVWEGKVYDVCYDGSESGTDVKEEFSSFQHWYRYHKTPDVPEAFAFKDKTHRAGTTKPPFKDMTQSSKIQMHNENILLDPPLFEPPMFHTIHYKLDSCLSEPIRFVNALRVLYAEIEMRDLLFGISTAPSTKDSGMDKNDDEDGAEMDWEVLHTFATKICNSETLQIFSDPQKLGKAKLDQQQNGSELESLGVDSGALEDGDLELVEMSNVVYEKLQVSEPVLKHELKVGVESFDEEMLEDDTTLANLVQQWFATKPESCSVLPQLQNPNFALIVIDEADLSMVSNDNHKDSQDQYEVGVSESSSYNKKEELGWRHGTTQASSLVKHKEAIRSPAHFFIAEPLIPLFVSLWWCLNIDLIVAEEAIKWLSKKMEKEILKKNKKKFVGHELMQLYRSECSKNFLDTWMQMTEILRKYRKVIQNKTSILQENRKIFDDC